MNAIQFENIKKAYGDNVVIPSINIEIEQGERLVLLGPSGCGKSTLLRMIAGLEPCQQGRICLNGEVVNAIPPEKRDVAMVFQNYALYPHMSVENNITYALKVAKVNKEVIQERLEKVLTMLDLEPYRKRLPKELSGGQRQRVALARATIKRKSIFLLDEPLSNLDAQLRVSARQALLDIHKQFGQTMVYVTHDQIEAMTFATKIILMNKGEVQMYDTPYQVYHHPKNIFTAKFIGSPHMNLIPGVAFANNGLTHKGEHLSLISEWSGFLTEESHYTCGIRPENVLLHSQAMAGKTWSGMVRHIENQGANYAVYIDLNGQPFTAITKYVGANEGEVVHVEFLQEHLHFFHSETEENLGRPEAIQRINKQQEYTALKEVTGVEA